MSDLFGNHILVFPRGGSFNAYSFLTLLLLKALLLLKGSAVSTGYLLLRLKVSMKTEVIG